MGNCFLHTRPPFWAVGRSTFSPTLALTVSSRTQQFSVSPCNHSKQNLMNIWSVKKITKVIEQLRRVRVTEFNGIPPRISGKMKDQHCTINSMNSLSVGGIRENFQVISAMQSLSHWTKTMEKFRLLQLTGDHSALHHRKNPCSCAPKQIGTHLRWWPSTRNFMWAQSYREITDMVFVLRQLREKFREQNKWLYVAFVDLTKAFYTVSRKGLWMIMERFCCPAQVPQHSYPTAQRD